MVQGQKWDGCVIRTLCCGDMCTEQRGYIYELAYSIHPQRIAGHISHRRMKVTALPNSPSSTPTQRKYFAYMLTNCEGGINIIIFKNKQIRVGRSLIEHASVHGRSLWVKLLLPWVLHRSVKKKKLEVQKTLLVMAVHRFPTISLDHVLHYLSAAEPPGPRVVRYAWPSETKEKGLGGIGFLEFESPVARLRAHHILSGQLHHTRIIVTLPSERSGHQEGELHDEGKFKLGAVSGQGSGSDPSSGPPTAPPSTTSSQRLAIDTTQLNPDERLRKASEEKGLQKALTWDTMKRK